LRKRCTENALTNCYRKIKPYWWDKEVEDKMKNKKQLYLRYLRNKNDDSKAAYIVLNRQVKQEVINKKNTAWSKR
jgi:hypothetical protein